MNIDLVWLRSCFPGFTNIAPMKAGGQKWVFSATTNSGKSVVLKLISPSQTPQQVSREKLAVDQVQSPRVPQILDHGSVQSPIGLCFYFVEERVDGQTVRELIQHGPMIPVQVLRLGLHILEALVKAEEVRIVHRDIKPDNIMIDSSGGFWLLDFGIARHLNLQSLTATSAHFGRFTVGYAPPEQFRNHKADIDTRADLFALGVTLYECATQIHPFRDGARDDLEILRRTEQDPVSGLTIGVAGAPEFANLLSALVQKHRHFRPSSAKEALEWMRAICVLNNVS